MGVVQLTRDQWVVVGVVYVLAAVLGWRLAQRDRRLLGRTPWGIPALAWAAIWLVSPAIGLVLYLVAHAGELRRVRGVPPGAPPGLSSAPPGLSIRDRPPTAAEQFPAYPQPANSPAPGAVDAVPPSPAPPQSAPRAEPVSPPAWHPDPSGRFHYRWWDGNEWTSNVATDGYVLVDTNPDQRIGPY